MSSIICLGNFGSGNKIQYNVSELIQYLIDKYKSKFILGLGNNINPEGVKTQFDEKFFSQFIEPYDNLPCYIKFYNVLGSNDYATKKSTDYEINYSQYDKKWILPHNFYCFKKIINKIPVEFIAIDTNFNKLSKKNKNLQEQWILNTLHDSKARYNIIFGHHPWKSANKDYSCNDELDIFYQKINNTKKVDLFIFSHLYNQQHIFIPNKPNMIISGVGGSEGNILNLKLNKNLKYKSKNNGCVLIEFNKKYLNVSFFNTKKEKEYSFFIHKL